MIALWMIYATAVACVLAAGAAVFERGAAAHLRQRRWVWMSALAGAVAIPAWMAFAPAPGGGGGASGPATVADASARGFRPPGIVGNTVNAGLAELIARADATALARFDSSLAVAWTVLASLALLAYGVATWSLARRRRNWRHADVDGHAVLLAPAVGPAVVGALRPQIVVPAWSLGLSSEQRALMLAHEGEHVRARDPLVLHAAALVALVMPWNVGAWWLNRRLRLAVEVDCDARVLAGGRNVHEYGSLLLDVCSRRTSRSPLLAPALLERPSSLTKRILAMHPERVRFPRTRVALGAAAAATLLALACEMPSPEMLAPDGKDAAAKRLFGQPTAPASQQPLDLRVAVARYFPAVARGEGGPSILFIVTAPDRSIVLTDLQPADGFARMPRRPDTDSAVGEGRAMPATGSREPFRIRAGAPSGEMRAKVRRPGGLVPLPSAVSSLRPDDIESIEVSKHAPGKIAPQAVSVIHIALKPGAVVTKNVRTF